MVRIFCFLIILALSGCANPKIVYGKETEAPWGWIQYCIDNPKDKQCKP